ncbi:hypothetical protein ZWY2020_005965 [Hordeum vulgare]|nr:hypothetical protein ZWY2020_005965 [Hordeum vulgare]
MATAAEGCGRQEALAAPTGSRPVPEPYQRVASLSMAKPSLPPPPNSGLRILLAKDRTATSSLSAPAVVSSHADRDRIIVSPLPPPISYPCLWFLGIYIINLGKTWEKLQLAARACWIIRAAALQPLTSWIVMPRQVASWVD